MQYATTKLKGAAHMLWQRQQDMFRRPSRGEVTTWAKIELVRNEVLTPGLYTTDMQEISSSLVGRQMSVTEYKIFLHLGLQDL